MAKHKTLCITVDVVVFSPRKDAIVLVRRKYPPFKGRLALPGGHVEFSETLAEAARRELAEETHLQAMQLLPLGYYDDPKRDPRWRIGKRAVSFAYATVVNPDQQELKAGDDAKEANWYTLSWIKSNKTKLAFDHYRIIMDAVRLMHNHYYAKAR